MYAPVPYKASDLGRKRGHGTMAGPQRAREPRSPRGAHPRRIISPGQLAEPSHRRPLASRV